MTQRDPSTEEARQSVFDTEDLADENVAKRDPVKKSFWSRFALLAILNVNLDDDIEPKPLSEADVDEVSRAALASGLTPEGLDSPFSQ